MYITIWCTYIHTYVYDNTFIYYNKYYIYIYYIWGCQNPGSQWLVYSFFMKGTLWTFTKIQCYSDLVSVIHQRSVGIFQVDGAWWISFAPSTFTGWRQLKYFLWSSRSLGKWSNLTNIFQMAWNHQLVHYWGRFCYDMVMFTEFFYREKPDLFISATTIASILEGQRESKVA